MALHDVDKTGIDRGNPTPNSSDGVATRMAHQTASTQYQPPGVPVTAKLKQVGKTIIANDGTNNVATYGYNPALQLWGLVVAKPGVNAMTNTDPSQLIFNSSQDTFKIVKKIVSTVPAIGNVSYNNQSKSSLVTTSLAHGLGYTPASLAFLQFGSTYVSLPLNNLNVAGAGAVGCFLSESVYLEVNSTNVVIVHGLTISDTQNSSVAPGFDNEVINIYLLQETAN